MKLPDLAVERSQVSESELIQKHSPLMTSFEAIPFQVLRIEAPILLSFKAPHHHEEAGSITDIQMKLIKPWHINCPKNALNNICLQSLML